jgi:hypothetical protein
LKLTRRTVATIVLLDAIDAAGARTFLGQSSNRLETGGFLGPLVSLLAAERTVLKFLACLAFMPCVLVDNTGVVATYYTCEDVTFHTTEMNLARFAGAAPSKAGCNKLAIIESGWIWECPDLRS